MIQKIAWYFSFVPQIIRTVQELEALLPFAKMGARKLRLLKDTVVEVWESVDEKPGVTLDELLRFTERMARISVAWFNDAGIFRHG